MSGATRIFIRTTPRRTLARRKLNWLQRASCASRQLVGGFLDVEILGWNFDISSRRFKFLPGNTGRTECKPTWLQQRRMRHETGNSSINLFVFLALLAVGTVSRAAGRDAVEKAKIEQLGDDFEAMMLQFMFNQLQQNGQFMDTSEDNPFAPSQGEKIFRGMRDEEMIKRLAGSRPLGFGDTVVRHIRGEGGVGKKPLLKRQQAPAVNGR